MCGNVTKPIEFFKPSSLPIQKCAKVKKYISKMHSGQPKRVRVCFQQGYHNNDGISDVTNHS